MARLQAARSSLQDDLLYIKWFPRGKRYLSLFPPEGTRSGPILERCALARSRTVCVCTAAAAVFSLHILFSLLVVTEAIRTCCLFVYRVKHTNNPVKATALHYFDSHLTQAQSSPSPVPFR